jgi:hypothetical protein
LATSQRAWLVVQWTYQQPKNQVARVVAIGVEGMNYHVAAVVGEHIGVGTVLETYFERVPTLFRDADDQHLVIMAQRLRESGIARRCTEEKLAEALFPLRAPTTTADLARDA